MAPRVMQISHLTRIVAREPFFKMREFRKFRRGSHAAHVKAQCSCDLHDSRRAVLARRALERSHEPRMRQFNDPSNQLLSDQLISLTRLPKEWTDGVIPFQESFFRGKVLCNRCHALVFPLCTAGSALVRLIQCA